ncbi:MAG: hypothetical protein GKR98_04255 [Boseongicola sp.]|nr:MAG: hypothetical protein GKR98_04255 [Boseongicola sp.]
MTYLPEVLPAHPIATEATTHPTQTIKYGLIGRVFLALEARRKRQKKVNLNGHMLNDIGLGSKSSKFTSHSHLWDAPAHWTTHHPANVQSALQPSNARRAA